MAPREILDNVLKASPLNEEQKTQAVDAFELLHKAPEGWEIFNADKKCEENALRHLIGANLIEVRISMEIKSSWFEDGYFLKFRFTGEGGPLQALQPFREELLGKCKNKSHDQLKNPAAVVSPKETQWRLTEHGVPARKKIRGGDAAEITYFIHVLFTPGVPDEQLGSYNFIPYVCRKYMSGEGIMESMESLKNRKESQSQPADVNVKNISEIAMVFKEYFEQTLVKVSGDNPVKTNCTRGVSLLNAVKKFYAMEGHEITVDDIEDLTEKTKKKWHSKLDIPSIGKGKFGAELYPVETLSAWIFKTENTQNFSLKHFIAELDIVVEPVKTQ